MPAHRYDGVFTHNEIRVLGLDEKCVMLGEDRQFVVQVPYKRKEVAVSDEYQMYETAPTIAEKWNDYTYAGGVPCSECGLNDVPIVRGLDGPDTLGWGEPNCRYCAELSNLTYHLRYNGTRRLRTIRQSWWSYRPELTSLSYSEWLRRRKTVLEKYVMVMTAVCIIAALVSMVMT